MPPSPGGRSEAGQVQVEASFSSTTIKHWADTIQARGLADIAVLLSAALEVWGFAGGQVLWMLAPFVGEQTVAPYALALEQPEVWHQLQHYLMEEGT